MIDYRVLLTKYIDHVGNEEGVDFIPKTFGVSDWHSFDDEELKALWECAQWDDEKGEYYD